MTVLSSFIDNIKQKTTNPFFGTLIIVSCFRNWELIYTLFNFDEDCQLIDKKMFIWGYFSSRTFMNELFTNIGISILLMILAYILIVITRVFVNWIDHKVVPELNQKFVSKLVVDNTRFEESEKQRIDNYNLLLIERENINKLEVKINELKTTINTLDKDLSTKTTNLLYYESENIKLQKLYDTELSEKNETKEKYIQSLTDLLNLKEKVNFSNNSFIAKKTLLLEKNISPYIFDIYTKLEERDSSSSAFIHIAKSINESSETETAYNPDFIDFFIDLNIINFKNKNAENLYSGLNLEVTNYGQELLENKATLERIYKITLSNSKIVKIEKL